VSVSSSKKVLEQYGNPKKFHSLLSPHLLRHCSYLILASFYIVHPRCVTQLQIR
jgi:hypothetical protein